MGPGIRVRPTGLTGPLVPGVPMAVDVTIDADHATTLRGFQLTAPRAPFGRRRWSAVTGAGSLPLPANTPFTLHLTLTAPTEDAHHVPLRGGRAHVDGVLRPLRRHFDRMHRTNQSVLVPDFRPSRWGRSRTTIRARGRSPRRRHSSARSATSGRRRRRTTSCGARPRRVRAEKVEERQRRHHAGRGPRAREGVRPETGFDDLFYEGRTDANGYFDWNVSCSRPSPTLYVETRRSTARSTQDGTPNSVWSFESSVRVDFTGNDVNFHTLKPADDYTNLAVHLCNAGDAYRRW